jgi:hypothetical protein
MLLPKKNQSVTVHKITHKTSSTLLELPSNAASKVKEKVRRLSMRLGIEPIEKEEKKEASCVDIPVFVGGKFVLKESEGQDSDESSTSSGK